MNEDDDQSPPVRLAVALEYDGTTAPKVTAKGSGDLADRILEIARENDIPLHEDIELVKFLASFDLNEEIPPILYRVVAEVIAFAYLVRGKVPEGFDPEAYE